jgi:hypothetical protein
LRFVQASVFGVQHRRRNIAGVPMSHVIYKVVSHDDGWAYTVDGVFSEPFRTHAEALAAARRVAAEQRVPGRSEAIEWEDAQGRWHSETARGGDRPDTEVRDSE